MIRTLLELQIQRYLDDGAPLPAWLAMCVRRDPKLRQFVDDFEALDDALLLSAAARRHSLAPNSDATIAARRRPLAIIVPKAAPQPTARTWIYWSFAAAAALLIAATIHSQQRRADAERMQTFSQDLANVPSDVRSLLTRVADSSQSRLHRYSPANLLREERADWQATASHVIKPLDRPVQVVNTWLTKYSDLGRRVRSHIEDDVLGGKSS